MHLVDLTNLLFLTKVFSLFFPAPLTVPRCCRETRRELNNWQRRTTAKSWCRRTFLRPPLLPRCDSPSWCLDHQQTWCSTGKSAWGRQAVELLPVPKQKCSIYDEITHISLLHTGGRNASWFSLIQFSTLTRLLLILERAVCCGTCCWPESCSVITSQSPKVGEGFLFIYGRATQEWSECLQLSTEKSGRVNGSSLVQKHPCKYTKL